MSKTIEYLSIRTNKLGLYLGFPYACVRFSDIKNKLKYIDNKTKLIVKTFIDKHSECSSRFEIKIDKIKHKYGKYFKTNILDKHNDLLDYIIVINAKKNVDNLLKEINKHDFLLLTVDSIHRRSDLIYLSSKLDYLLDLKVIENNCLLLFR